MYDYEYKEGIGTMPSGEKMEFATEQEYAQAYSGEEDEIIDELARLHYSDELIDYPEDWKVA